MGPAIGYRNMITPNSPTYMGGAGAFGEQIHCFMGTLFGQRNRQTTYMFASIPKTNT